MHLKCHFSGWLEKVFIVVILSVLVNSCFGTFRCSVSILLTVDFLCFFDV